ncbi:LysR family transcriptional regulator [Marinovum sp. 2_MG-2023]|uniref:LysR family transcriptional regulator n=1 Tax=unclassified Marinovum TaxID=2647166 RepID=UPI0026E3822F|nr:MULTISPECIES: LysR family transcriptional regulator [unclassified Marinovum]MDO6731812.1 LysR family transcriptional regulator [Marinovum sp. 2_MG-2023]MDO6781064.1 LysR family transcriptional regulator [Marinovum sp. 1_MG-2023]
MDKARQQPIRSQDLELLRVFCAVAKAGGITAAESTLGLERSTISRHVKALEARLGATLCQRGPSGFSLTEMGKTTFYAAVKIEDAIEEVRSRLNNARHKLKGKLRIGIADHCVTNPQARFVEAIEQFTLDVPDVSLEIEIGGPNQLLDKLSQRQIQACIVGLPVDASKFSFVELFEEEFALCMSGKLSDRIVTIADLGRQGMGLVARSAEQAFEATILEQLELRYPIAIAQGLDAVAAMIATGRFVGLLPRHTLPYIGGPRHKIVEVPEAQRFVAKRKFALVYQSSRPPTRALSRLISELQQQR